jgi:hypothetical protein
MGAREGDGHQSRKYLEGSEEIKLGDATAGESEITTRGIYGMVIAGNYTTFALTISTTSAQRCLNFWALSCDKQGRTCSRIQSKVRREAEYMHFGIARKENNMRTFLYGLIISIMLGLGSACTALADDPAPEHVPAPAAPTETTPPAPDDQGVESRGLPKIRSLTANEISLAKTVFHDTINYGMVRVTDTLGLGSRPWTSNTPPIYTLNVGEFYSSLTSSDSRKRLLIHELAHVWQGQHLVPFMLNSAAHQTLSAIANNGDVAPAYSYTLGKPWREYNVEQQASIVTHWFTNGMKTTDGRYPYVRDHIRNNKAF